MALLSLPLAIASRASSLDRMTVRMFSDSVATPKIPPAKPAAKLAQNTVIFSELPPGLL